MDADRHDYACGRRASTVAGGVYGLNCADFIGGNVGDARGRNRVLSEESGGCVEQ
eukprot:SAG11_NODE_28560_length_320_cov_0.936652_1_plen_54_part_10